MEEGESKIQYPWVESKWQPDFTRPMVINQRDGEHERRDHERMKSQGWTIGYGKCMTYYRKGFND